MNPEELRAQEARQKLYSLLYDKELFKGTKEEFHDQYAAVPETQKELHEALKSEGVYTKDFNNFQKQFFLDVNKNLVLDKTTGTLVSKKKETGGGDSVVTSPTGLPQATTTNTENNTPITPIIQPTTSPTNALVDGASAVLPVTEQTVVKTEPIKNPLEQMQARLEELSALAPTKPETATDQTNSWEANLREIATKNAPNLTAHLEKLHAQKESDIALLKERKDKGLITQTEYDRQAKFYEEDMQKKAYEPIAKARAEINVLGDNVNDVDKRILAAADLLSSEKYTKAHDKPEMDALKEIKDEAFNSYKAGMSDNSEQMMADAFGDDLYGQSPERFNQEKTLKSIRAKYGIKPEDAAKLSNEGTLQAFLKKGVIPTSAQVEEYQKTTLAEIRKTHPALQDGDIAAIRTDLLQRAAALPQQEKVENQMKKEMTALGIKAPEQLVKEFTDKVAVVNTNYTKTLDLMAGGLINANKQLDSQYKNDTAEYNKKSVEALTPLQGVIQTKKQELESAYQALQAQMDSRQLTGEQANQAKVVMDAKTQEYNALVDEYNKQQKALQTGYLDIHKAYSQQKTKLQQSITSQSVKLEEVKKAAIANIERLKKEHNITTDQAGEMGFTPEYQQKYASLLEQVYKQDELDKTAQKNKDWDNLNLGQKLGISLSKGLLQVAEMSAMGAKYFAPGHDAADFALQDMAHFREQLPDKSIGEFEFGKLFNSDFSGLEWLLHKGIEQAPLTLGLAGIGGKAFFAAKGVLGANYPGLSNFARNSIASLVGGGASRWVESKLEAYTTFDNALKEGKSYADAMEAANTVQSANMALMIVDAAQTYSIFSRSSKLTALSNPAYKRLGITKRIGYFTAKTAFNVATEGGEEVYQEYLQAKVSNPLLSFTEFAASPQGKEVFALGGVMGATFSVGSRLMYGRDQIAAINDQISQYFDSYLADKVNFDDLSSRLTQLKHTVQTLEERGALTQEEANNAKFQLEHQSDVYRQGLDGVLPFEWNSPQMKEYSTLTLEAKLQREAAAKILGAETKADFRAEPYLQKAKELEGKANKIISDAKGGNVNFSYTVDGLPFDSKEEFEQFAFDENNADAIESSGAVLESDDPTTNLKLQKFGTVEKRATLDAVDYMDRLYPDRSNSARFATEFRKNQAKALAAGKVEEAKKWEVAATQAEEASTFDNQKIKAAQNAIQKEITALEQNKKTTNAILPNVRGRNNRIKELRKLHNNLGVYHDVQTQAKTAGQKVAGQKSKLEQQAMANAKTQTAPKEETTADNVATVEPIENIEQLPVEGAQPLGNSEELPTETAVTPEITAVTTTPPPQETPTNAENAPVRSEFHSNRARKFANRGRDIHYEGVKDLPEGSIVERDNNRIIVGKKTVGEDGSVSIEVTHQTRKDEKSPWEGDRKTHFGRDKMNNQNGNTPVLMRGYGTDRINVTTPTEYQPTAKELHEDKLNDAKDNKKALEKALKKTKQGKNKEAIADAQSRLDKANKELEALLAINPEEETVAETKEAASDIKAGDTVRDESGKEYKVVSVNTSRKGVAQIEVELPKKTDSELLDFARADVWARNKNEYPDGVDERFLKEQAYAIGEAYNQNRAAQNSSLGQTTTLPLSGFRKVAKEEVAPEKPIVETKEEVAPPATETTKEEPITTEPALPKTEPIKLDDTPIDAAADRKRGYRIRNRIKYNRQSTNLPNKIVGDSTKVRFSFKKDGRPEGHFVLMEAADVQASHQSGLENPLHFIGEGQPKDRTLLSNEETRKAVSLVPEELGRANSAFDGAPVVNERGEGIQGNGRAGAIKLYYNTNSYNDGRYQQWLAENAEDFGFTAEDVAKFKQPILVRMIPTSDEKSVELGNYAVTDSEDKAQRGGEEKQKIRRLNEAEVAEMVGIITKEGEEDDTLNEAIQRNAKELLPWMVGKGILSENEAKEGTKTGRADSVLAGQIENLVKELFLNGQHPNLTSVFDGLKDGNENDIVGNMIRNMPLLLLLPQVIKNGFHNALLGIRDFLNNSAPISKEATKITKEALIKRGMTAEAAQVQAEKVFYAKRFAAWANQSAMAFGSSQKGSAATLSPIELEIVKFFAQIAPTLKNANKTRLAKVYRDFLSTILSLSNTNIPTNQTDMFGGATTETTRDLSPAEVIGTALNQMLPESDKINVQTLSINQQQYEQAEADKLRVQSELEGEIGKSETTPTNVPTSTDVGNAETNATGTQTVSENDGNGQDVVGQSNATTSESEGIGAEGEGNNTPIESVAQSEVTLAGHIYNTMLALFNERLSQNKGKALEIARDVLNFWTNFNNPSSAENPEYKTAIKEAANRLREYVDTNETAINAAQKGKRGSKNPVYPILQAIRNIYDKVNAALRIARIASVENNDLPHIIKMQKESKAPSARESELAQDSEVVRLSNIVNKYMNTQFSQELKEYVQGFGFDEFAKLFRQKFNNKPHSDNMTNFLKEVEKYHNTDTLERAVEYAQLVRQRRNPEYWKEGEKAYREGVAELRNALTPDQIELVFNSIRKDLEKSGISAPLVDSIIQTLQQQVNVGLVSIGVTPTQIQAATTIQEAENLAAKNDEVAAEAIIPNATPDVLATMLKDGAIDEIEYDYALDYIDKVNNGETPNAISEQFYHAVNNKIKDWWATKFAPANNTETKVKEAKKGNKKSTNTPKEPTAPKEKTFEQKAKDDQIAIKAALKDIFGTLGTFQDPTKMAKLLGLCVRFSYNWAMDKLEKGIVGALNKTQWTKDLSNAIGEGYMRLLQDNGFVEELWNTPLPRSLDAKNKPLHQLVSENAGRLMAKDQPRTAPTTKQSRPATQKRATRISKPPLQYVQAENTPDANEYLPQALYGAELDEHQRFAVNLALTNFFDNKKRGFMLADSMGVGKTRQILALAQEYAKRTGKKVLIITERQSIIDTSFIPDAKAMGIDPSQFEMTTYNQLDARADRQFGEYGLVIYDESQALKNPGKRYNKTRDIKTDHVAYSSATPADRIGSTIYYLSDILGVTPAKMMEELGVKPNSESGQWESTGTVSSADAVQKINDWTQQAFKEGAMIRREYPFWGTIQENSVTVLPKNADGTYTEEGARMALEYQQVSDAYDNSIKSVKPGRYVRNDHQYDEKGVYLGVDEQTITTDGWRKSFAEYRGLSDVQSDMLDEQKIKELREQKINMLDKLVESYKATVIIQDIVNQLNNGNAVVLMTQTVNEIEISGLRGKKDNKEKRKSLLQAVKEQLQQRGIEFVEMTGNSDKTQAIKDFQSGKVNVVLGSTQSMAAGVSLDASSPEMRPRVLMIPSPSYSADQFTQAMGRVSRRNTVIPATVSVIYTMDEAIPSDRAKQGKVEKKGSLLQVAQGYGLPQEYKDRLENEKQITTRTKGEKPKNTTAPTIRVLESGKSFVVENSYDIKESLKKLGGVWNAKEKAWMFKMSQKATIEEWLANNEKATQGIISGNEQATNEAISDMEQSENDAYYEDNMGYDSSQPQELTDTELNAIDDQDARSYKATQRANPRIQTAPEDSGDPIRGEQDILVAMVRKFGLILSKTPKNKSKKTLGSYNSRTQETTTKDTNDFDTLVHELGHFFDDVFVISPLDGSLDTELAKFWVWGSPAKGKGADARQKYRRAEGIAEFVRALMLNPSIAKVNAPGLWLQYQAKVPKEVQDAITEFGKQLRNNAAKPAHDIIMSKEQTTVAQTMENANRGFTGRLWLALKSWWRPDTTLPQFDQNRFGLTKWQRFKRQFSNKFAFFEEAVDKMEEIKKGGKFLPGADPRILARLASSSHSKAGDMMENGVHDLTRGEDAVAEYQQLIAELLDIKKNIGFANPTDEQTAAWIKTNYKGKNKGELMAYLANPEAYKNNVSGQGMARYKDPETGDTVTFKWMLQPLRKDTESTLATDMDEVLTYMLAERTLELEKRGLNNGTILGLGGNLQGKMDKPTAEKRLKDVEGYEDARKQAIKEAARRYRVFADAMLKYMLGKGRMSQDQYDNIKKNNEYYVALRRVYELSVGESTDGESFNIFGRDDKGQLVGNPIRAIKGSTRTIKDNPYEQLIESMNAIVRESDRSEVTNAFFDIVRDVTNMRAGMYDGAPLFIGDIAIKRDLPENYSGDLNKERLVVTFNKGVKEFWYIPDAGLYESIVQIGKIIKANHPLLSALNSAMRMVRMSITKFLTFGWNNFKRDVWQRFINSRTINNTKDGLKAFIQALEAFLPIPIFTHIASYRGKFDKPKSNLAAFGGDQSGTFQNEMAFDKMLARQIRAAVRGNKKGKLAKAASYLGFNAGGIIPGVKTAFGNFWQSYEGMLDNLESKTRINEFNSAFKHAKEKLGYNDKDANMYAAFQARDLMDFAKHGEFMYYVNQVLLFSNASVQGLSRTMQSAKENPLAFGFKALLGVALPSMIMLALSRMGDYEDEYDELRPYMRDMFYNFKLPGLAGEGTWVRVPKPFEVGVAGAIFERMANYWGLVGKANPHAFDGYWNSLKRAMIPIFGNTDNPFEVLVALSATKPLTEVMFNHDMFRDQSIVSPFEENLHVSMRKGTDRASELGKVLADNPLTNLLFGGAQDPRYADHLITGYFGYFGRLAQDVGQGLSGEPTKNSGKVDIPETPFYIDWMLEKTGAFRGQNSFQIEALNQVGKIAKDYGLAQTETAKQLKALADDYTALPSNTPAKEAAFSKLLKASRVVRDRWEVSAPQYQQWKEANPNALPLEKKMKLQEFFGTNIQ